MTDQVRHKLSAKKAIEKPSRAEDSGKKSIKRALDLANEPSSVKDCSSPNGSGNLPYPLEESPGLVNDECYRVRHPTGDKRRDTMRQRLAEGMYKKEEDLATLDEAKVIANAIEAAIADKFGGDKVGSRQKYQNLIFNLKDKKNFKLRSAVLGRLIAPKELVEMGSDELANDETRERRRAVQERMTRDAQPFNKQAATTNMFKCGKCKGRNTTYYQMQTRSADEPLTTFVQCTDCSNRWRF